MTERPDSLVELGNLLIRQERERFLHRVFRQHQIGTIEGLRVFEANCGTGTNLRLLVQWGLRPADATGLDENPLAIAAARVAAPAMRFHSGSPTAIPEADETFDLALAFGLFRGIPDEETAHAAARELSRITRPGGLILVYDMRRRGLGLDEGHPLDGDDVRRWFPHCPMRSWTLTLDPVVARFAGRWAPALYGPLTALPFLRTHAFHVLRRPALAPVFAPLRPPGTGT